MRPNTNPANKPRSCLSIVLVVGLCCFCYAFGSWQQSGFGRRLKSGYGKGDTLARAVEKLTDCTLTHVWNVSILEVKGQEYKPCDAQYTDYTPCQDENRAMKFPRESMIYRERHCPSSDEKLSCLVPAPKGYLTPFHWPMSRDYVPYANVPHKSLTVEKAVQKWLQIKGNVFKFPGGGTMFPQGADAYIDQLASIIPIADGTVRTALDTGCGVASWGAYLLKRNVIAMSFAPRDSHEAQVQFALERGVPAIIGVLGTIQLPYPSRAFDMAHCSRCLIPWASNDGMYLMEVDRVLRPGGYWVLSGPPINWRNNYQAWQRSKDELEEEQRQIEELAELLCWEKVHEKANLAIWRKKINAHSCKKRQDRPQKRLCQPGNPDDVWYKEMVPCITPYSDVSHPDEVAGGALKKFPERLSAVAPRIASSSVPGVSADLFVEDMKIWRKHVNAYKRMNKYIGTVRYRNIMDMNAGFGSFAAELESNNSWVMNVVPTIADKDTLGVIYERGLIGIYHDWCEAFSTYPRTYDLIHANGVFSLFQDKCNMEDILLEMDRILRPEGAVIFRDNVDILNKVKTIVSGMRWNTKLVDHEDGPESSERILLAVKRYWTLETEAELPS